MEIVDRRKIIPLQTAIDLVTEAAMEVSVVLTPKEELLIQMVAQSCPTIEDGGVQYIFLQDLQGFMTNLLQAIEHKDSSFLTQKRGLCVDKIVGVEEFIESREYMGQIGHVRPKVMEILVELFESGKPYVECCLAGSISWGKNYTAEMAMHRMVYYLSCFHNPQAEFGLAPGSSIVFIQQSKTQTLAKKVVFDQYSQRIKNSPFFKNHFAPDPYIRSELRFPKNISILPVGGGDSAAIGMNVWGGIQDELNFMARVRHSEMNRMTGEEEYDQAEKIYTTLSRRMKTRFIQRGGKVPGKLLLISATNYPGDFTSRKGEEAKTNPQLLFVTHSFWEVLPPEQLSPERFLVEVGGETRKSRILESKEDAVDEGSVIEVPTEFRIDFEKDLEGSLRDIGGISCGTKHPFIPNRDKIQKAADEFVKLTGGRQLFTREEVCLSSLIDPMDPSPDWSVLIDQTYLEECLFDRGLVFSAHADVGITADACGLGVGHISGYRLMPATKVYDPKTKGFTEVRDARLPIFTINGALRVIPPRGGGEIDLDLVMRLVLALQGELNIKWASCDSYQSAMMIQGWRKAGIRSGVLSVDETCEPYNQVKFALNEERILYPPHPVLLRELRELERDPEKNKISHPDGGSKDCGDGVAGVVHLLHTKEASYGAPATASHRTRRAETAQRQVRAIRLGRSGGRPGRRRLT